MIFSWFYNICILRIPIKLIYFFISWFFSFKLIKYYLWILNLKNHKKLKDLFLWWFLKVHWLIILLYHSFLKVNFLIIILLIQVFKFSWFWVSTLNLLICYYLRNLLKLFLSKILSFKFEPTSFSNCLNYYLFLNLVKTLNFLRICSLN